MLTGPLFRGQVASGHVLDFLCIRRSNNNALFVPRGCGGPLGLSLEIRLELDKLLEVGSRKVGLEFVSTGFRAELELDFKLASSIKLVN